MKKHNYQISIEWTGNKGSGTTNYRSYGRDHEIIAPHKQITIPGSSDASFKGDKTCYNPEELLVSSISACHMLWYLHLCADNGINVISYKDHATGIMEEFKNGSGKFSSVTLAPEIQIENYKEMNLKATELHQEAHKLCFIANSVNFEVILQSKISSRV